MTGLDMTAEASMSESGAAATDVALETVGIGDEAEALRTSASKEREIGRPLRNLGQLAGGQIITWGLTAVWTLIVPRALGPSGFGVIVTVTSVAGVLGLIVGFANPLYLAREMVGRRDEASGLLGTAVVVTAAVAPLMALAAVVFAHFAHYHSEEAIALYLATAIALLTLLTQILQAGFQAIEEMRYIAYSNVVTKSAQNAIGVVVVLLGLGTIAVITGMAVVVAVALVLNVVWLARHLPINLRTNLESAWRLTRESLIFWAATVFGLIYLWIDTIMLSLMTDKTVVGWYGVATTLFQTMLALPVLVTTAWLPRYVTAFARSADDLRAAARRPIEVVIALSLPLAAGTAMFSRVLIVGLYGSAYAKAAPVMVALAVCMVPMYANMMLGQVAIASRRQRIWTWLMVVSVAVNTALNLVLIPLAEHHLHNGAIGAGWAMVLTELVQAAIAFALVGGHILNRRSFARILGAGMASGAMLAVRVAADPLGIVPALGLAVVALLVGLLAFRAVTREELQIVRRLVIDRLGRRSLNKPSDDGAV
jgi:O-antigen/teichoic acid export membrane protein